MLPIADKINIFLKEVIGTPYKFHGRDLTGLDCYGLCILYYRYIFNIELYDWNYSLTDCRMHNLASKNYFDAGFSYTNSLHKLSIHDIILFKNKSEKFNTPHMAVYLGNEEYLHILINEKVKISLIDNYFRLHFLGILRRESWV